MLCVHAAGDRQLDLDGTPVLAGDGVVADFDVGAHRSGARRRGENPEQADDREQDEQTLFHRISLFP